MIKDVHRAARGDAVTDHDAPRHVDQPAARPELGEVVADPLDVIRGVGQPYVP
jgi:hypothetical protein